MKKILVLMLLSFVFCANKALQVDFLNAGVMDIYGKPLANGQIYFYENDGGTTQKAVYADINKTTTLTQPIRTNSSGIPVISGVRSPVFADGTYRIVIYNSSSTNVLTLTGMQYTSEVDFGGIYVDIAGTYGYTQSALNNALNAYNSLTKNVTFLFKEGTYAVNSSMVMSSNITVKMLNGAKFSIASGQTLTISGNLEANAQDIFDGSGTVVLASANGSLQYRSWTATSTTIDMVNIDASNIYLKNTIDAKVIRDHSGLIMPVGSIIAYGGVTAPLGWFICDGATKDKTVYADLFTAISGNFGITGNAFYLPDLRGRFLRGLDDNVVSRDADALSRTAMNEGGNVSKNIGTIQSDQYKSHQHTYNQDTNSSIQSGGATTGYIPSSTGLLTLASGGSETRPINAYVNYIIKW